MGYYSTDAVTCLPPILDHHFRVEWDEERGLQTVAEFRAGACEREIANREWWNAERARRRLAGGWIGEIELDAILADEVKLLGRPPWDLYRLQRRFRLAIQNHWPKELFPDEEGNSDRDIWLLPLPKAGREETIRLLHTIAYRGLRTGSLPKAVQDVIRSRRIKGREEQGRVVTQLAK